MTAVGNDCNSRHWKKKSKHKGKVLKELNSNAPRDIVLCLLGNKADLTSDRNVAYEDAKTIAEDNLYYEVSAKTGNNVSLDFEQLTYGILEKQKEGKKKMRQIGNVEIPQAAFLSVLKLDEDN